MLWPRQKKTLNIAHRGGRAFAPENTMAAFQKAHRSGCDAVECDVHLSKDGIVVIHHDNDLLRCTDIKTQYPNQSRFISDYTYDDLQKLDAGSWYAAQLRQEHDSRPPYLKAMTTEEEAQHVNADDIAFYRSGHVKIPRLEELLAMAGANFKVCIELKTIPRLYPGLGHKVLNLVRESGQAPHVMIMSYDHQLIADLRKEDSQIALGIVTSCRIASPADYLRTMGADYYMPGSYGDYDVLGFGSVTGKLDHAVIRDLSNAGYGVNPWTCNDPMVITELLRAGVTGIISDYPNRTRTIINSNTP